MARCSWQVQCACTIARLSPCSLWPFSFSLKSIDAKIAGQQHSVYFFSSPGLLEHDFMKKTTREKIWSARVSRLECTRSPRPVDRGRPQCPVSYPDNNSASHLFTRSSRCGFVAQWLERATRIRKTLGSIPGGAALCFFVWSGCQFFYLCRCWKRREFDRNDPDKSEFTITIKIYSALPSTSLSLSLHKHTHAHAQKNIHLLQTDTQASHTTITTNIHARTHAHILNTNVQNAQTETESRFPVPLKTYLSSLFKCPSPAPLLPPPDSSSFHVADDLRSDHVRRPSTHPVQQATTVITE